MTAASGERPINDKQTRIHLPVLWQEKQTAHHMRHLRCEKENNPEERDLEENEMNELKPCPFCGNEKATINLYKKRGTPSGDDGWNAEIRCKCHALVRFWALKKSWARQSAIEAWNSRAEQGQTDEAAKLKRELERVKQERDAAVECIERINKMIGYAYVNEIVDEIDKWRGAKEE